MLLKRYPYRPRHEHERPDPDYGVGYRPDWPSILSVAHDTTDGGAVYVVTDRPCVLVPGPLALPLGLAGLAVVGAAEALPVKFRVRMSGAVPRGAAWTWDGGAASSLVDPVTGHAPNPAAGDCADTPGPYPPPPPAAPVLVAAAYDPGESVTLTFDRPVDVAGMDVLAVVVDDGAVMGFRYRGLGTPALLDPATVSVPLSGFDDYAGPGVTLSVAAGNGIVAVEGGAAWAGAAGLSLPFP